MANDEVQRLKAGTVSSYALRNDASALMTNWTRQTDMEPGTDWGDVTQVGEIVSGEFVMALDGSEAPKGYYSGAFEWFVLTEDMRQYLKDNIFGGAANALVTLETYHQELGLTVFNCRLKNPFGRSREGSGIRQSADLFSNIIFEWFRGSVAAYGRDFSSAFSSAFG